MENEAENAPVAERIPDEVLSKMDKDSPERYQAQKIEKETRDHRVCADTGCMDFAADEFLYKPSALGDTEVFPGQIAAGDLSGFEIQYRCGEAELEAGSYVRFVICGQQVLGTRFQSAKPQDPGFIRIFFPDGVEGEPYYLGFQITGGTLKNGDRVILKVEKPFRWTPLADRYELKTVIGQNGQTAEMRLCSPAVILVTPLAPDRLEATLPITSRGEDRVRLHITARDRLDNPVDLSGRIIVDGSEAFMANGKCDLTVSVPADANAFTVHAYMPDYGLQCESTPCVITDKAEYQLFIGDLHVHDFLSQAHQYTDKVYEWAIHERNFDFVSVSEQTHGWIDNEKWTVVKYMNERYLDEGRFVTLLANEWQHTMYGDKVIHHLGGTQPYFLSHDGDTTTAKELYAKCRQGEAVVISHHSAYPAGSWCNSTDFDRVETDVERLCELWSMHGSSEGFAEDDRPLKDYDRERTVTAALKRGVRIGFVAGSDTHSGRAGGSAKEPRQYWGGCCGVLAKSLTRKDLFEALKARRTIAYTGARIYLCMKVNGAYMGSEIEESDKADITVDVVAPGEIEAVMIMKNADLYKTIPGHGREEHLALTEHCRKGDFYHVRVKLKDGNLAVCSPVWLG